MTRAPFDLQADRRPGVPADRAVEAAHALFDHAAVTQHGVNQLIAFEVRAMDKARRRRSAAGRES